MPTRMSLLLVFACRREPLPTPEQLCDNLESFEGDWASTGECGVTDGDCFHVSCRGSQFTINADCYATDPTPETYTTDASLEALAAAEDACLDAGGVWWFTNCDNDTGASGLIDLVVGCTEEAAKL